MPDGWLWVFRGVVASGVGGDERAVVSELEVPVMAADLDDFTGQPPPGDVAMRGEPDSSAGVDSPGDRIVRRDWQFDRLAVAIDCNEPVRAGPAQS